MKGKRFEKGKRFKNSQKNETQKNEKHFNTFIYIYLFTYIVRMESVLNVVPTTATNAQQMLQSLSLTGNIYIDSFIFMNIFTLFKSYLDFAVNICKTLASSVFQFISYYIRSFLKSKLTGKIVLRICVENEEDLYKIIQNRIFKTNIEGDVNEDWKFRWLRIENDLNESNYFERWKEHNEHYERPVTMEVDYQGDDTVSYNSKYYLKETVTKIFALEVNKDDIPDQFTDHHSKIFFKKDRKFYVRFTWKYDPTPSSRKSNYIYVDLIMFDLPKQHPQKKVYFEIVKNFLKDRFNLFNHIIYKYHLVHSQNSNFYSTYNISEIFRNNAHSNWLKFGDNDRKEIHKLIKIYETENPNVTDKCFALQKKTQILLTGIATTTNQKQHSNMIDIVSSSLGNSYYNQLMHICGGIHNAQGVYGYFSLGDLIVVINYSGLWIMRIGKRLSEEDARGK